MQKKRITKYSPYNYNEIIVDYRYEWTQYLLRIKYTRLPQI